jgi:hypothetical protein
MIWYILVWVLWSYWLNMAIYIDSYSDNWRNSSNFYYKTLFAGNTKILNLFY